MPTSPPIEVASGGPSSFHVGVNEDGVYLGWQPGNGPFPLMPGAYLTPGAARKLATALNDAADQTGNRTGGSRKPKLFHRR